MSELRTNRIVPRDGISASGTCGGVIQMKVAQHDSAVDLTAAGDIMSTTYTPIRSDSKILIDIRLRAVEDTGNTAQWYVNLKKTVGGVDSYPGGQFMMHNSSDASSSKWAGFYQMVFDSAGGSQQITYTIAAGPWGSNNGTTFRVNGSTGDGEVYGAQLIMYEVAQ